MPTARPRLHLTAQHGWLNDPLGVTWRDGRYHVFFQHVPGSLEWRPECHWGHATSPDLASWQEHPVALTPDSDEVGCWSGCVVPDAGADAGVGAGTIVYSAVGPGDLDLSRIRLAHAQDAGWDVWRQDEVVIAEPPVEGLRIFRDPVLRPEADGWRMLVGAGTLSGVPQVLTLTSPDLRTWSHDGVLVSGDQIDPALDPAQGWECPNLVEIDGRHVLVLSLWHPDEQRGVIAAVGDYADGRFAPESWHSLTTGAGPYAPTAFVDTDGEPTLVFWVRGIAAADEDWAGSLSMPLRLTLRDGTPRLAPHPAIRSAAARVARADGGVLGLDWEPEGELELIGDSDEVCRLAAVGEEIVVTTGNRQERLPGAGGPVHLLLDGCLLQICAGTTLLATQVTPSERLEVRATGRMSPW